MEKILKLEITRPKKYILHDIIIENYFHTEKNISRDIKDINTIFQVHKEITMKYERIRKKIQYDIMKIIMKEKDKEVRSILYNVEKMIDK